ncbi:MAG: T9SS type A sorting domain-containing protein [Chitinophagales bacterium]|nr:T9SS type A sorting domain-containing protein [Chitinophagales bacterium]
MEKLVLCGRAVAYHSRVYTVTPPNGGECCTNGAVCPSDIDAAGRIRYLIKQNDQAGIVAFLTCLDEVWAYRILVTTLIDQGKYSQALTNLLRIPDNSADNIEFKAMCNAIIANLQSGANVGGRQSTENIQNLRNIAQQSRLNSNNSLAESHLALLKGDSFVRTSAPIEAEKGENAPFDNETKQFSLLPNPAKEQVQLIWHSQETLSANTKCYIYSFDGSLVKTISITNNLTTIPIQTLPNGVYYCRLNNGQQVEKLIIVK